MFEKLPFPLTNLEPVDRALRAILERLLRFELVGNFVGTPANGQVPTYNAAERRWEPQLPRLPEYTADPPNPALGEVWVRNTGGLSELRYRLSDGSVVGVVLS